MSCITQGNFRIWSSLENYLQVNIQDYSEQVFSPDPSLSPYKNYALANMHTTSCHEYVCEHIKQNELESIFMANGLPMPFLLEAYRNRLKKASVNIPVVFRDSVVYSDWIHKNIQSIESNYTVCETVQNFEVSLHSSKHKRSFSSVCLTPEQSDRVEMKSLLMSSNVERLDNMSVMDDPIIYRIMNLYLYLNNPSRELYLHHVVHSLCGGFPSSSTVNRLVSLILLFKQGTPDVLLPTELLEIAEICLFYRNGVEGDALITYIEQLTALTIFTDRNRLLLLKNLLTESEKSFVETPPYPTNLSIINSLTSPVINTNETIVSQSVPLNHLHITGKRLFMTDIYN